jgi:hypothetical protein
LWEESCHVPSRYVHHLWFLRFTGDSKSPPDEQPGLRSCDALVHQDLYFYAAIFGPSSGSLIGRRGLEFAHRAWRHDAPHRNIALSNQVTDNRFGAIFAQDGAKASPRN